jgi:hypothetical protein
VGFFDRFRRAAPPGAPGAGGFRLECSADLGAGPLPVFPLLMPETWQRAPTQVCRPVIGGVTLPGIPVVALAYLIPQPGSQAPQRGFIRKDRVDQLGKTVRDFESEALHNVAMRPASWSQTKLGGLPVAGSTDDYLAAERILDPAFLQEAHRRVADTILLVGIPRRGELYATSLSRAMADPEKALAFSMVIDKMFHEAGEIGITRWSFLVTEGRITSVAEFE